MDSQSDKENGYNKINMGSLKQKVWFIRDCGGNYRLSIWPIPYIYGITANCSKDDNALIICANHNLRLKWQFH